MLSAAERLLQPDPIPNLAYHLATLALEEVGKETPRDDDTPMASPAVARGLTPSRSGGLAAGQLADIVVIDTDDPAPAGRSDDAALDAWVFAAGQAVRHVFAAGRPLVIDGRHVHGERIRARYAAVVNRLLQGS